MKMLMGLSLCLLAGALAAQETPLLAEYLDGNRVAVVKNSGLRIIDARGGTIIKELPVKSRISALLVTEDYIFLGGTNGAVYRYSAANLAAIDQFQMSDSAITALAYGGGKLLAGDSRGKIGELPAAGRSNPKVKVLGGYPETAVTELRINSQGNLISMGDSGAKPRLWNTAGRISGYFDAESAKGLIMSKNKTKIGIYTIRREIMIFNGGGKHEKTISLPQDTPPITGGAFSPDHDSKYLALSTLDGAVVLDTKTGEVIIKHSGLGNCTLAYRPDGKQYAVWNNYDLRFFDAPARPTAEVRIIADVDALVSIRVNGNIDIKKQQIYNGIEAALIVPVGSAEIFLDDSNAAGIYFSDTEEKAGRFTLNERDTVLLNIKKNEAAAGPVPLVKTGRVIISDKNGAAAPQLLRSSRDRSLMLANFGKHTLAINFAKGLITTIETASPATAMDAAGDKVFLGVDNEVHIFAASDGRQMGRITLDGPITAIEAGTAAGGPVVAAVGSKAYIIEVNERPALTSSIDFGAAISAMSLYNNRLAIGGANGDAGILDIASGQFEPRLFALRYPAVTALSWIDEKYMAIAYADGLSLVLNGQSGVRSLDPIRGPGPVRGLTASVNGKQLNILHNTQISLRNLNSGGAVFAEITANAKIPASAYWSDAESKIAVAGMESIEFYTGNSKRGALYFFPGDNEYIFVSTPAYAYDNSYYHCSTDYTERRLAVKLRNKEETRPMVPEDRAAFKNFSMIKTQL
ncbi:MAG: WD40 repeat domain-containing protein [Treponema sp.]|jgi:hypothetical protein|nr:WD40 repeat domain-containing protein [Treponema sp.]